MDIEVSAKCAVAVDRDDGAAGESRSAIQQVWNEKAIVNDKSTLYNEMMSLFKEFISTAAFAPDAHLHQASCNEELGKVWLPAATGSASAGAGVLERRDESSIPLP